ncbi:MAG: hypothetical protein C0506_05340 [Anaerolinea sp.]|nr:hypothetical protein [Anaerolinea sp.]
MKLLVDHEADALYLKLNDDATVVESEEVQPGIVLDFDADEKVVGLEILGLSSRVPAGGDRTLSVETTI